MTTHVNSIEELTKLVGTHLGYSDYRRVTQEEVNLFADATGDHQWIHVDPERAATGPFGHTIAHGYLTLSLIPVLRAGATLVSVDDIAGGAQVALDVTVEVKDAAKPSCVAQVVYRYYH